MPVRRTAGHWVLVAVSFIVVFAAVSAVSGAAVMVELFAPGATRDPVVRQATHAAAPVREAVEADPRAAVAVAALAVAAVAVNVPEPVRAAPTRPAAVRTAALQKARVPMSASELTFAKGYAKRHAALEAARSAMAPPTQDIKLPAKLTSRAVAFNIDRPARLHRHSADGRRRGYAHHAGGDRYAGDYRYAGYGRHRAREGHGHYDRYAHYDWR